jgi:hypothetical protein
MSIKLTSNASLLTPWAAFISGQSQAGISYFFRYDGAPSAAVGNFNFLAGAYNFFEIYSEYVGGIIKTAAILTLDDGVNPRQYPSGDGTTNANTIYHVLVSLSAGSQKLYINGIPATMGSYSMPLVGGVLGPLAIGDSGASSGFGFSVRDVAMWSGYAPSQADAQALRDGADPSTIGGGATARWHWPLATVGKNPGDTVSGTDSGLADTFGHSQPFNSLAPGSGTILYTDAMPFVPAATAAARVDTSGKAIYVVCSDLSGNWTPETQYVVEPTIAINGGTPFQLGQGALSVVRSQFNRGMLYILPSGMQIAATDVVTISAPGGFVNTAAGMVAAMNNQAVTNRVGRSYFGSDAVTRTLKLGINYDDLGFQVSSENWVTKNLRPRAYLSFGVTQRDSSGRPTKINVPTASTQVAWTNSETNGLDQTGNTQPAGLWAVRWDTTNGTVLGLASNDGTCTHHPEYDNAGSGGVGRVAVYDIQPISPLAGFQVQLTFSGGHDNGDGTYDLSFANDAVLGPGNFTPAAPTVIPMPGEGDAAASLAVRCPDGVGTVRWENSSLGYDMTNACDPEHLQPASDWAYQGGKAYWRVGFTQARPFNPTVSPYVYSHLVGEDYTCTLAVTQSLDAPASGTIQSIHIADASATVVLGGTGPIFPSQTLINGSEQIRVLSIDAVDGTLVTVERGAVGTTPQSLAAGSTLTVRYRHAVPTSLANLTGWSTTGVDMFELVTPGRHNVRSGMNVIKSGGWPTFTFTDGFTWNVSGDFHICWVTGPNTMLQVLGPWDPNNAANCTLSTTYTLNPSTCYSDILIPDSSNVPYEIQAAAAGNIAGANAWVNMPILATDAYVYKLAQTYLAHSPAGRRIYIELQNEPWNLGYTHYQIFSLLNYYSGSGAHIPNDVWPWDVRRSGQIRKIWKDVFNAAGRGNEVFVGMNVQIGADDAVFGTMNQAKAENLPIDFIANAPYWDMPTDTAMWLPLMYTREMDLVCSLASYHLNTMWTPQAFDQGSIQTSYASAPPALSQAYGRSDGNSGIKTMIDKWNAQNATWNAANLSAGKLIFLGYEGGPDVMFQPLIDSVQNTGGMDSTTTSLVVTTARRYFVGMYLLIDPIGTGGVTSADYWIVGPNTEWVKVTAIDTTTQTLTVVRAQSGTTARAHAVGVGVRGADYQLGRDMIYHPNFRIVEQDYYATLQQCGYDNFNLYAYDKGYFNYITQWGIYHGAAQLPGKGDGSDGKANNLACLAAPGPGQKSATVNQDAHNVSVRGQALLEWNQPAGTTPQTTPRRKFKYVPPPRYR